MKSERERRAVIRSCSPFLFTKGVIFTSPLTVSSSPKRFQDFAEFSMIDVGKFNNFAYPQGHYEMELFTDTFFVSLDCIDYRLGPYRGRDADWHSPDSANAFQPLQVFHMHLSKPVRKGCGCHHTGRNAVTVFEPEAGEFLQRVAHSVTKVQDPPVSGFFLVGLHDAGFEQAACRDYSEQRIGFPLLDGMGAVFHKFPQYFISDHSRLDHLGHSLP